MRHSVLVVIGGGAAGISAALAARRSAERSGSSCSIIMLERNARLAAKIRISGGGKCNVTHCGTPAVLLEQGFLRLTERRFLRHALYGFSNSDLLVLLQSQGVETAARADGKVFPTSGDALSVVTAFERLLRASSVQQHGLSRVRRVERKGEQFLVSADGASFLADAVILATGGVSYSKTGTSGDGLAIARSLGHSITPPLPALAPIFMVKPPPPALSGVALRSIRLFAVAAGDRAERRGDLLFTHRGFSGPAALSLSRDIAEFAARFARVQLFADLFPEQSVVELEEHLLRHGRKSGAQMVRKFLQSCPIAPLRGGFALAEQGTIPTALVPFIMQQAALHPDVTWSALPKEQRQSLLGVLKSFPLGNVREVPLDQGEISAGGVVLREVNPKTMESRLVPKLFLCGELLDYAGEIGGFNLQAAFSTGWLAGSSAL